MTARHSWALLMLLSLVGCEGQPGERFEGMVEASAPLITPLGGAEVCVAGLSGSSRAPRNSPNAHTSLFTPHPRYAPGAVLRVNGERLSLVGDGGAPSLGEIGETWRWVFHVDHAQQPVPEELFGWGRDSTLRAIAGNPSMHNYSHVTLTERFVRCGDRLSVRAIRRGDTLELVDTNPVASRNALRFFGGIAGACFFFCFLPIMALGLFILRRHSKRRALAERSAAGER